MFAFSYVLYFIIPMDFSKQFLGILFGYFEMHRWAFVGSVMVGLGTCISSQQPTITILNSTLLLVFDDKNY